jgi:hypothetical protein
VGYEVTHICFYLRQGTIKEKNGFQSKFIDRQTGIRKKIKALDLLYFRDMFWIIRISGAESSTRRVGREVKL